MHDVALNGRWAHTGCDLTRLSLEFWDEDEDDNNNYWWAYAQRSSRFLVAPTSRGRCAAATPRPTFSDNFVPGEDTPSTGDR